MIEIMLRAFCALPKAYKELGRLDVEEMADWLKAQLEYDGYRLTINEAKSIVKVFYATMDELHLMEMIDESERSY